MTCTHSWIVETPNGPTSRGTCTKCFEEKDFDSYYDEYREQFKGKVWQKRNDGGYRPAFHQWNPKGLS